MLMIFFSKDRKEGSRNSENETCTDKRNGGLNGTSLVLIFPFSGHEPAGCNKGPLKSAILHSGSPVLSVPVP